MPEETRAQVLVLLARLIARGVIVAGETETIIEAAGEAGRG